MRDEITVTLLNLVQKDVQDPNHAHKRSSRSDVCTCCRLFWKIESAASIWSSFSYMHLPFVRSDFKHSTSARTRWTGWLLRKHTHQQVFCCTWDRGCSSCANAFTVTTSKRRRCCPDFLTLLPSCCYPVIMTSESTNGHQHSWRTHSFTSDKAQKKPDLDEEKFVPHTHPHFLACFGIHVTDINQSAHPSTVTHWYTHYGRMLYLLLGVCVGGGACLTDTNLHISAGPSF